MSQPIPRPDVEATLPGRVWQGFLLFTLNVHQSGDYASSLDYDRRPAQMVVDVCGSIEGFKILELGPPKPAATYQLERLGAGSILSIEASPEFYLKSLIVKEILRAEKR